MGLHKYSDYGSASSCESFSLWTSQDFWSEFKVREPDTLGTQRCSSTTDVPRAVDAVMREFRMNGYDSPYDPEQETRSKYSGFGPSSQYLRQRSWPEAACDRRDVKRECIEAEAEAESPRQPGLRGPAGSAARGRQDMECRFCKNNGERAAYYRSHRLRTRGRVTCPVLRAYTCARCGAKGDHAHTNKYCPLTSQDERIRSAAMMHSVRTASGRRRHLAPASGARATYLLYGETCPATITDGFDCDNYALDPLWEALERKLTI